MKFLKINKLANINLNIVKVIFYWFETFKKYH